MIIQLKLKFIFHVPYKESVCSKVLTVDDF